VYQCPYYDGTTFADGSRQLYRMWCGLASVADPVAETVVSDVYSMNGCFSACYNLPSADCTSFTYSVNPNADEGTTDASGTAQNMGNAVCILRRDTTTAAVQSVPPGVTRTVALTNYAYRLGNANTLPTSSPTQSSVPTVTFVGPPRTPTTTTTVCQD
jgi:hypothetical protein